MLYPTSGSRLFIADRPTEDVMPGIAALPADGWSEIGELEALGFLGGQWEMSEAETASMNDGREGSDFLVAKRSRRRLPMQVVLGLDPADPGQLVLWQAYRFTDAYPFRLVLPEGLGSRSWWGLVTSISEVFDTANNVMRLLVDVLPCSDVER